MIKVCYMHVWSCYSEPPLYKAFRTIVGRLEVWFKPESTCLISAEP
jgi:hypothetical protein